jgi:Domain of unknown function (DUF1906)
MSMLDVGAQMKAKLGTLLLGAALGALLLAAPAAANDGVREVRYRGASFSVPSSWPVLRLAADPTLCVRLDRRAVYLGRPGPSQRCPAHAVGRNRAILIEPTAGGSARRVNPSAPPQAPPPAAPGARRARPAIATASAGYFTGLGFDACSAPPVTTMSAWLSSPYRAIGVYIGGINRGCSQPNLTPTWVATQITAGWKLIPTYVGLQAPTDVCGCASINPSQAVTQGIAAADDAVTQATALGIGTGNPIYFDMEGYSRTKTNSSAVLTFLDAWTDRLHQRGYVSGVYGSASSTITDLVSQYGLGYSEPDDVWIAHWDGLQNTSSAYVPASYWPNHQRLKQYRGGHNERWGGVTLNIDNNYLDGAVVGALTKIKRINCPSVVFARRPASGAFKIRAFNVALCGPPRRVAGASRQSRFSAAGRSRVYRKEGFSCAGRRLGRAKVLYECRRGILKIRFVRRGLDA